MSVTIFHSQGFGKWEHCSISKWSLLQNDDYLQAIGFYRNVKVDTGDDSTVDAGLETEQEKLEGMRPSYDTGEVCNLYEIHCNLDLEGFEDKDEDGDFTEVKLPYIVTIDTNSDNILSIRRNFAEDDPMKNKIEYFVLVLRAHENQIESRF